MALTETKAKNNAAHLAKLDTIRIQPYKAEGEKIRAAAAAAGMSLQGFILQAIREKLERDGGMSGQT